MTTSTGSALSAVEQRPTPVDADSDGFQLDVRMVDGPVAAAHRQRLRHRAVKRLLAGADCQPVRSPARKRSYVADRINVLCTEITRAVRRG